MKKIGFEQEFFLINSKKELVLNPSKYGFETDNLGVLVEVRGSPKNNTTEAIADIISKILMYEAKARSHGYTLLKADSVKLTDEQILKVIDLYKQAYDDKEEESKKLASSRVKAKLELKTISAGMHVHFSKEEIKKYSSVIINQTIYAAVPEITLKNDQERTTRKIVSEKETIAKEEEVICNTFLDMPKIIGIFDNMFATEIKEANRIPSAYEIKPYGFEYRSLPSNIDKDKLIIACQKAGFE